MSALVYVCMCIWTKECVKSVRKEEVCEVCVLCGV